MRNFFTFFNKLSKFLKTRKEISSHYEQHSTKLETKASLVPKLLNLFTNLYKTLEKNYVLKESNDVLKNNVRSAKKKL